MRSILFSHLSLILIIIIMLCLCACDSNVLNLHTTVLVIIVIVSFSFNFYLAKKYIQCSIYKKSYPQLQTLDLKAYSILTIIYC